VNRPAVQYRAMQRFEQDEAVAEALIELGHELRVARTAMGHSQASLAGASGVDQGTISRLENGRAPGLRFASYARLVEITRRADRRAAEQARILEEIWATHRPPWERIPPPQGPLTIAQWYSPNPPGSADATDRDVR
jgi:transcriptional regulator with XRE-family HTH domain